MTAATPAGCNCASLWAPGTKRMPREWHKRRRGGGNCRELGATWATKRALISIEARVIVTVSSVRASQATIELLLLPRPGYLHSTGCQFEAHPQAIGTGALTHIEDARVIFIEISAICADFYMGIHYALCQSVNVCVCWSLWAICCATNAQLIAHGLVEKLLAFSRIVSKDLGDKRVWAFVVITIKRLGRQTSCAQLLNFSFDRQCHTKF